jgi:diguanylate cyclase (GGDEF)-like protein
MHDQALVWNTDLSLQVTSLSARLRGYAGNGARKGILTVNDLWGNVQPASAVIGAHQWALGGESLSFEAAAAGVTYRFDIQPLEDARGSIVGVAGRAVEVSAGSEPEPIGWHNAERFAGMGTWHEDLRTGLVTLSEGLSVLLGIPRSLTPFAIRAFDHPDDAASIAADLATAPDGYTHDHRVLAHGSRVRIVRERVRTLYDDRGVPVARIGTLLDISDLKEREAELSELALHDPLTRLHNRAALHDRLGAVMSRCTRGERRCAVLFVDLDGFKGYNDTCGHDFGDAVLVRVARRLTRHVRGSDMVARYGGDEFVIVIEDLFTDEAALDAARKILRTFDEPFEIGDRSISVGASIGVATYAGGTRTPAELLAAADHEMYAVKRNGGSGVKLRMEEECGAAGTENTECPVRSLPDPPRYAIAGSASPSY